MRRSLRASGEAHFLGTMHTGTATRLFCASGMLVMWVSFRVSFMAFVHTHTENRRREQSGGRARVL